jgi:hypothetical protein
VRINRERGNVGEDGDTSIVSSICSVEWEVVIPSCARGGRKTFPRKDSIMCGAKVSISTDYKQSDLDLDNR